MWARRVPGRRGERALSWPYWLRGGRSTPRNSCGTGGVVWVAMIAGASSWTDPASSPVAIPVLGEFVGSAEEEAAEFIANHMTKPVSAYVAGVTAPPGKKMGHAGAIVSGGRGTAAAKMDALRAAGVRIGLNPTEAGEHMADIVAGLG